MLCSYEQELYFKHLRKWQFSRGEKREKTNTATTPLSIKNPNQCPTGYGRLQVCQSFPQWLCRSKAEKSQTSVCSVIRQNKQSEFDVSTLPDWSQGLELGPPAFRLSIVSTSLLHYSGWGLFVFCLKCKGKRKWKQFLPQIPGAEPWA